MLLRLISACIPNATLLETGTVVRNGHKSFSKVGPLLTYLQINAQNLNQKQLDIITISWHIFNTKKQEEI